MKLDRKGFSSLELFGVILVAMLVITGVCSMLFKTSEEKRKNVFIDLAKKYGTEIELGYSNNEIACTINGQSMSVNSLSAGDYAVLIDNNYLENKTDAYRNATALIKDGGKSPWGSGKLKGYVTIRINPSTGTKFYLQIIDSTGHGIKYSPNNPIPYTDLNADSITRGNKIDKAYENASKYTCRIV